MYLEADGKPKQVPEMGTMTHMAREDGYIALLLTLAGKRPTRPVAGWGHGTWALCAFALSLYCACGNPPDPKGQVQCSSMWKLTPPVKTIFSSCGLPQPFVCWRVTWMIMARVPICLLEWIINS